MVTVMVARRWWVARMLLAAAMGVAGCGMDHADQEVIDRLLALDIMVVPGDGIALGTTTEKGGGVDLASIRNPSTVTLVYASDLEPTRVAEQLHQSFDDDWILFDEHVRDPSRWTASGRLRDDPGTFAEVEARAPVAADHAPAGSLSVVTISLSATRDG